MNLLLLLAVAASATDWGSARRADAASARRAPSPAAAANAAALPPAPPDTREPMIDREEASRPVLQRTADIIPLAKRGNQARGLATSEIGIPDYKPMALAAMPAASNAVAAAPAPGASAAGSPAARAGSRTTYGHAGRSRAALQVAALASTPAAQTAGLPSPSVAAGLAAGVYGESVLIQPETLFRSIGAKRARSAMYEYGGAAVAYFALLNFTPGAPLESEERWLVRTEDGTESVFTEPSPAPGKIPVGASVLLSYDASKVYGERHQRLLVNNLDGQTQTTEFYHSPLVLDLNGDGVRMSRRSAAFDAGGALVKDAVHDISKADGLLVFDADRDGTAGEGGQEAFGTATDLDGDRRPDGHADGFAALRSLVARAAALGAVSPAAASSGRLDAAALRGLARVYGLAVKVGGVSGRVVSLEEAGVTELRLPTASCRRQKNFDGQGNEVLRCAGAEFVNADGATRAYEDVFFQL